MTNRYNTIELISYIEALFSAIGMDPDKSAIVAPLLVEADLMGHTTHGIAQAPAYLSGLQNGLMSGRGDPITVSDRGATITWDGQRISGIWLTAKAIDLAVERAKKYGTATMAIRRSGHIACLAAFLTRATDKGCMIELASSDPSTVSVAPYGGTKAAFTPNPIAIGIPTNRNPILIDISASITTNGLTGRLFSEGKKLPGEWVQDSFGQATNDPAVLFADPPGTILPIGGKEYGHKGYGLALMVEALTQALSGLGRADPPEGWGAAVYLKVTDPTAFAGLDEFKNQTTWLAETCRNNPPADGVENVRLPGDNAFLNKAEALQNGIVLYPGLLQELKKFSDTLKINELKPI